MGTSTSISVSMNPFNLGASLLGRLNHNNGAPNSSAVFALCVQTSPHFNFPLASPPPPPKSSSPSIYPRKRARPLADIDGLESGPLRNYSKKRRLRYRLVTSRLSEPFAVPPTNILGRVHVPRPTGSVPAQHIIMQHIPKNALRKAAILNRIKLDAMAARQAQERQVEIARQQFRERLAAAARSNLERNAVLQLRDRKQSARQQRRRCGIAVAKTGGNLRNSTADPHQSLPKSRWPPPPPSEGKLEVAQRSGFGMGLHIGCDVY